MIGSPDPYAKVKDLLSRDEFERRIQEEIDAWGGLLSKSASALLIVDALGRNEVTFGQIADLYEGGRGAPRGKGRTSRVGPDVCPPRRRRGAGGPSECLR